MQEPVKAPHHADAQIQKLVEARRRFEQWCISEENRRRNEQLERVTLGRAVNLFNGGQGGTAESLHVQQRLMRWLHQLGDASGGRDADADPTLADILWWKGERVFVGEVSAQADVRDVIRTIRRAETLRRAGVNATPFALGEG